MRGRVAEVTDEEIVLGAAQRSILPNNFVVDRWRYISGRRVVTAQEFADTLDANGPLIACLPDTYWGALLAQIWKKWPERLPQLPF